MPMKTKSRGNKRTGTLIMAPNGDFYFLGRTEGPLKIPNGSKLDRALRRHFTTKSVKAGTLIDPREELTKEILELLEVVLGPLGIWHILSLR